MLERSNEPLDLDELNNAVERGQREREEKSSTLKVIADCAKSVTYEAMIQGMDRHEVIFALVFGALLAKPRTVAFAEERVPLTTQASARQLICRAVRKIRRECVSRPELKQLFAHVPTTIDRQIYGQAARIRVNELVGDMPDEIIPNE